MEEYFVVANSFAAPFCSDTSMEYVKGETPEKAMVKFRRRYDHPAKLYAARLYEDADAYYKKEHALVTWDSPEAIKEAAR